ncbi:hypothetical protein ACOTC5_32040 [Achromobacter xylosoxidans]
MATMATRSSRFTGQAYQLCSRNRLPNGSYVAVNGPWDTYGVVTSSKQQEDGQWLNQIRGVKKRAREKPVAQF